MKAKLVDSIRPGDRIYEIKFDCYRALALRGGSETRVLSRNEKDLGKKFPEVTPLPSTRNPHWPFCSKQADNISQRVLNNKIAADHEV